MRKYYTPVLTSFSILFLTIFSVSTLSAQTTLTTLPNPPYNGSNGAGTNTAVTFVVENTNAFPILLTNVGSWINSTDGPGTYQLWYSATSLSGNPAPIASPTWTQIAQVTNFPAPATSGITNIFTGLSFTIPAGTQYRFAVWYVTTGSHYSGTGVGTVSPSTFSGGGVTLKVGDVQIGGQYVGYGGPNNPRWFTGTISFQPAGPCTNPPVPGTVVSTSNPVCLNTPFTLSLSGGTGGTGQTYQWQISPDNTTWTNIPGATGATLTTSQTTSNYYRAVVTCGVTVNSGSLQVITPAAVSGTFTINSAQPTGGTNFQTFNAAYNYISCGISGPVVFNVAPGSGPYTEQLIINPVPGASAVNTVTFNGNGRVIQFTSTNTNERAVIKLNGADHFRFDSLTINATASTTTDYGFGVQLLNGADSNIIRRCLINITSAQISTNHVGISISASATSATGTGTSDCDGNLFELNTITGGYYGITNVGSTTVANQRNRFVKNIIRDFYLYGIYVSGTFQTLIDGNDFSRPARTNLGTGTGAAIFFTSLSTSARVNGNYIHGLFDVNPTTTNDVYGIFFSGTDALAGLENIVSNNAIYDIKSNGTIYGLYNSSSDNVFYYHNTVSLDDLASTTTEATRGFYQVTTATGIEFKNNIITLRRGGTGQMHAIYFGSTASTIVSNYNDVFFNPAPNVYFGFSTTNHATLAAWQAATSQDLNSVFLDPVYQNIATGNLRPTNPALNNLGTPVGILTDIVSAPRSTTNPDMGAWEFDVGTCTAPPVPGNSLASPAGPLCPNEFLALSLLNNSSGTGQTYQWQTATSLAGPWTNLGPVLNSPGFNTNPTSTFYYRAAVTCGASTTFSTPVQVVVNPLFPAGTYTINSAQPTAGTNYQSFNDAYFALRCGIAGPVVFNVVPGSGPYTEQLIMGPIQGTSATNTVTFNGNGRTIQFLSTNTNERAVIKLNGTDHFIFDSLNVVALGTTTTEYGFGFHLINGADSNIIRNSTININTTSTSTNYAGIVSSASHTSATGTGTNGSDFNVLDDNTITGGYYGITSVGSTTEAVGNNRITNNRIRDFYFYGAYLSGNFNTLVEANDISRPTRATVSSFFGVYMTSLNTSVKISKNRIHNPFDAALASTSQFGGIYLTGVDALAGLENVISNNAIYNVNGEGTQYGLYNSSSDNVLYYYNTINLDGAASTANDTYGFYQTGAATGIDLKNNLITITRGGPGNKYLLYFATTTSTITSNYNGFYKNAQNSYVGYNGSNQATLADWQTATGLDANSTYTNPFYTNAAAGNLEPRSPVLDNKGTPIPGITTDIRNLARSATTPDVGAWEFTVPACTTPPVAGTATANPNTNLCIGNSIALNLTGYSIGSGQSYQWQFAPAAGGPYTNLGTTLLFPDTTILASGTFWYRAIVTCGAQSVPSAPVLVTMNPPFPAGTYTINNTQATTYPPGTNFNSFAEAVAVMDCGIAGPVIFNVAPGTYNEQIRIRAITGTSPTSRVTFQSANGNPASVTLTYNSTNAAQNYVLQLDSARYITFKNMTITATNATNGRAVDFVNTASHDSLVNNVINVPPSLLTTTTIVGVHGSNLTGTNLVIKGNTVNGGSSGIHMVGLTAIPPRNIVIDSNTVNGSYYYGIHSANLQFTTVSRNIVNVASPRNTTSYGIYITNNDSAYQVNANRVNISGTSTTVYGIYLTGTAAAGYTGSVSRNIVTGLTGITGSLYGIYQTTTQGNYSVNNVVNINTSATTAYGIYSTGGSGGLKYYNNSVQNASPATGTTNVAAFFSHSTSSAGVVDIRNNIFSHTANGIAMQQGNVANIYLDYNMYYTAGPTLIRSGTTNHATLQAWRNAENWDYSSIVYPPAFAPATNLQPDVTNPDSWAMHGRGIQIADNASDINGNPRPTTLIAGVPDLGAYEFLPTVIPPVLPATPAAPAPGITQRFMFGTDTVQKITWAPGSTVPATVEVRRYSGIIPPGLTAGQRSMYFYVDDDFTGSTPTNFTKELFYIDSWMRDIPSEPTVKLGRTNAANVWQVAPTSTVDPLANVIRENNLSFLDKFTGMTDGTVAPPPPPPPFVTDTSNRGRRFWVGYGHHYGFSSNGQDMVLYLSAEDSANVTVKVNGTSWVRNYAIPANTVRVSDLLPESGLVDARLTDEGLFDRGISIESDVPIVAYAHIYQGATSGAGLLLPTGTYGYEYRSLNSAQYYPSGGAGSYSWFYVIADRDSTLVEITPSVTTKGGRPAGVPFQVYLMRGQVYNVMGTQATSGAGTDISGSTIKSIPNASGRCFPIAVFSGSSRTAICNTTNGDNMIQQVFPNTAWGTKYLTFGTANSTSNNQYYSNKWRIMVKDPATVVRRNGVVIPAASLVVPGNYYEFGVTGGTGPSTSSYIEADQPVMVAQYMISSDGTTCPGLAPPPGDGDPEMIYISPLEQGIKKAVFYSTDESAINSNYINVIIPTAGLPSLRIDGASTFTDVFPHPNLPGYTAVRHNLGGTARQHIIISDSAFNAITYGLGSVESYGYNAGTLVKNLSALPSFTNVFSTGTSSTYTCKGTPFRLTLRISVKPTQLVWNLNQVPNLSPNAVVTQVNPVPTDSVTINGKKFYIYTLPLQYTFNTTGTFTIPINVFHPSIEGCLGSQEVTLNVTVIAAPVANFTFSSPACVGSPIQFNGSLVTSNAVPPSLWNWNFGDTPPTTATVQNPVKTYTTAGTYNVNLRAIATDGCVGDTTKQVVVNARPVVSITQDTVYVCNNASAVFTVQNPITGVTYNWYSAAIGGTLLGTGTTLTVPNVTGFVNVYLEGIQSGCASTTRDRATAAVLPTLQNPVAVVDSVGTNIIVFRWSSVPGATSYQVSTNGGSTWVTPSSGPLGLTHSVTPLALGTTVTLQVRALGGCLPAVSAPVSGTTRTDQVFVPNSFTPNNDNLNDRFLVYSNVIRELRMTVFNQWGEKIFESSSQGIGWDGTHKGKPQPSGVYIYVINITLNTGERIQRKGAVNLVR